MSDQLTVINSLYLEGRPNEECIHLSKIILAQRKIYRKKLIRRAIWNDEVQAERRRYRKKVKNSPWNKYSEEVRKLTEKNAHLVPNIERRAFRDLHLDHIVSVWQGFINKVPAYKIASLENLRMIPYKENMIKGTRLTDEAKILLKKFKGQSNNLLY